MGLWHLDYLASKKFGVGFVLVCVFICVWKLPFLDAAVDLSQFVMISMSLRRQFYGLSFREATWSGKGSQGIKKTVTSLLLSHTVIAFLLLFPQIFLAKTLLLIIRNWKDETVMCMLSIFFQWRGLFFKIFVVLLFWLSWGHLDNC